MLEGESNDDISAGFSKGELWSRVGGPLLAAGAAAAIEALSRGGFTIPNPPAVLILIVVFSAFHWGIRLWARHGPYHMGVLSLFFSVPGHPLQYTGDEVLVRLQGDPETRHIPVLVISADATRGRVDRLLAAGACAYLTKPLDVKKLLALLDEALKHEEPSLGGPHA